MKRSFISRLPARVSARFTIICGLLWRQADEALAAWITWAAGDVASRGEPPVLRLEAASHAVRDFRKARRERVLRGLADGRQQPGDANRELESLRWLNGAVYHAWRVADSLQQSMGE